MGTDEDQQKDKLREAYRRGLEQGYRLGRKMRDRRNDGVDGGDTPEGLPAAELPLFIQQLLEIAHQHGVDYE